jgi:hypothetical protein
VSEDTCPNLAEHTPQPSGYLAWHDWARRMAKTHRQKRCKGCNLYAIWVPKTTASQSALDGEQ